MIEAILVFGFISSVIGTIVKVIIQIFVLLYWDLDQKIIILI